jgi:hypothetical protein
MQARNSETDDHRGMSEPIDERDRFGNRIRVDATYYIDIYDLKLQKGK